MAYLLFADYSRRKGIPSEFQVSRSMLGLHGTPSRRVKDHLSIVLPGEAYLRSSRKAVMTSTWVDRKTKSGTRR